MLRGEDLHETGCNVVGGVRNLEEYAEVIIIQDGPLDCANPDIAGGSIEAFDAKFPPFGWYDEVIESLQYSAVSMLWYGDV